MKKLLLITLVICSVSMAKAEKTLDCERDGKIIRIDLNTNKASLLGLKNSSRLVELDSDSVRSPVESNAAYDRNGNVIAQYTVSMGDGMLVAYIPTNQTTPSIYLGKFSKSLIGHPNTPVEMSRCSVY